MILAHFCISPFGKEELKAGRLQFHPMEDDSPDGDSKLALRSWPGANASRWTLCKLSQNPSVLP
jgi:hypothetical protein